MTAMPKLIMIIFIAAACVIVLGPLAFFLSRRAMFRGIREQMHRNDNAREVTVSATVIGKRAEISGMRNSGPSTWYYVAFETDTRQRIELMTYGNDYGILFEGDRGLLTYRGDEFVSFQRY